MTLRVGECELLGGIDDMCSRPAAYDERKPMQHFVFPKHLKLIPAILSLGHSLPSHVPRGQCTSINICFRLRGIRRLMLRNGIGACCQRRLGEVGFGMD